MKSLNKVSVLLLSILLIAFSSCATMQFGGGSVRPEIQNIYLSSVTVKTCSGRMVGSGTIIHNRVGQQMFVLTAAHVVRAITKRNRKICITPMYDNKKREMQVYKIDRKVDLALIYTEEMQEKSGPSVNLSLRSPDIGDPVWVIGAPLGAERTVTNGIVSNFQVMRGKVLYRTTAATFYGNSGGGMFNASGELIGVAHGILEIQRTMFSTQTVPGGFFFVGLETIRKFM